MANCFVVLKNQKKSPNVNLKIFIWIDYLNPYRIYSFYYALDFSISSFFLKLLTPSFTYTYAQINDKKDALTFELIYSPVNTYLSLFNFAIAKCIALNLFALYCFVQYATIARSIGVNLSCSQRRKRKVKDISLLLSLRGRKDNYYYYCNIFGRTISIERAIKQ